MSENFGENYVYTLKEADSETGPFMAALDRKKLIKYAEEFLGKKLYVVGEGIVRIRVPEIVYLQCDKGYWRYEIHKVPLIGNNIWGDTYG